MRGAIHVRVKASPAKSVPSRLRGGPGGPRIVTLKVAESYPASLVSFNL